MKNRSFWFFVDCTKFIIHPSIGENGWILASLVKNPPLITSTWVNGCELTGNEQIRVNYCNLFFRGWIIFYMRNGFDDKCTANRTHCRVPCLLCMFALLSNRHYLELFFFTCFLSYSCNQFSNSLLTQTWIRTDDLFIVVTAVSAFQIWKVFSTIWPCYISMNR